jgi:AcrR family transcriptional regulator
MRTHLAPVEDELQRFRIFLNAHDDSVLFVISVFTEIEDIVKQRSFMRRGLVPKPDTRRAEIMERLADHVLANGLSASSLRPLAKAAGTSDRMLLYYFADKTEMMTATLGVIAMRIMAAMEALKAPAPLPFEQLQPIMLDAIVDDEMWPFMRVWLEIASLAANGDAFYRAVGEQLGRGFLAWGAAQIDAPDEVQRQKQAAQLLVMAEGMVVLKSIGLDGDARAAFDLG